MPNIKFDWTMNMGHVMSMLIFVAGMVTGWVNLNDKVTIIDERTLNLRETVTEIKNNQAANRNELRQDIQNLRTDISKPIIFPRVVESSRPQISTGLRVEPTTP